MTPVRRSSVLSLITASLFAVAVNAVMAQAFPNKPMKLVIPFPAGSGSDLLYRPVAEHMAVTLGQPVLIDPRPGGGSVVASVHVKNQPADGYTFYVVSNSVVVKSLVDNPQIDIRKDFTPLGSVTISPMFLAVNIEKVKATTMKEFIEEARANPGRFNYGSYGIGSGAHVFMEMVSSAARLKMVHVPFQGTAQSTAANAAGDVHINGSLLVSAKPFMASGGSGKVRIIGTSTGERTPLYPEAPGMKESGFPDIDYPLWGAFAGPAGVPRPIVDRLNQAINIALRDPKIVEFMARGGNLANPGTPDELARNINREYDSYVKLMKETGFKFD